MPEDEKIKEIRRKVADMKLQQIAEEISRLEFEKLRLEKENELKLNKVGAQLNIIPARIKASHPILSKVAEKLGQGAYAVGREAYHVGQEIAKNQRLEELHNAELAKKGVYVETNPLNRLVGYKPPMSSKPKPKKKVRRKKHKRLAEA